MARGEPRKTSWRTVCSEHNICYWSFAIGELLLRPDVRAVLIEELTILANWEFSSMIAVSSSAFISSLRRIIFSQIRVSLSSFKTMPNL